MDFIENSNGAAFRPGSIEVITGSMFSGKTEELIRRLRRARFAGLSVDIFKPSLDKRYSEIHVVSHDEKSLVSTPVDSASSILLLSERAEVIGIDEAQFFDNSLVDVCNKLADEGKRVIVAGLDMDFLGNPFGPVPALLAIAESITKVHAICMRCGNLAQYSFRKSDEESVVLLGEKNLYEPLCRKCYNEATKRKS
ncbi:MAG TPA: thymidine kinase [Bacteroidales bacterium]|nr:thymidine kinase [Bacteroidales bacterium]